MEQLTRRQAFQRGRATALILGELPVTRSISANSESSGSQGNGTDARIASVAEDTYRYGLRQAIFYETRFNYTQKTASDVFVGINRRYRPNSGQPITTDVTAVSSPDATTLYSHAFLYLRDEPVVIDMPEVVPMGG